MLQEKPPVLGMVQRGGDGVIQMLDNVQQQTIRPHLTAVLQPGTRVYTEPSGIHIEPRAIFTDQCLC